MRTNITRRIAVGALVCAWIMVAPAVRADERYYMVVFAYEDLLNTPHEAHIRLPPLSRSHFENGSDPRDGQIERHTISWLPATLDVKLLHRPEAGKNLGLRSSLQLGVSEGAAITA